ncbi:MAG: DNA-binding protein YbiB [Acidovorax sp.]|uniref:DNA-binding protein YbiB n=1 Tax=Acidovorax sp. TaxID=1872122 RepID=UPI00261B4FDE|nr:DNA-binding protein YbiB [Acidovorax sp.]MDH4427201.1 DNA-binding protein YbiB [Acidovorax sp.]
MAIGNYIKEIGRGKEGARALSRAQATDLLGQVLDGTVTDLEVGAFCLAMRIKGETAEEMAGFLDAVRSRMALLPASDVAVVVIPSYNGARKLPLLTPLLALLLAREGLPVLIHGTATEDKRVFVAEVLAALGVPVHDARHTVAPGRVAFVPTGALLPGLQRLLDVRRVVHLRNPAHSLVKLMNPVDGPALIVSSYTHPEYAVSMADTFTLVQAHALLIRGTEGEAVADARRTPKMQAFVAGKATDLHAYQAGALSTLPALPTAIDAASTAAYIQSVMQGHSPVPAPIAEQVAHLLHLHQGLHRAL